MSLLHELKRRNVIRVATAYVVGAWIVVQVVETLFPVFGFSDTAIRTVVIVLAITFLPVVVAAWFFELTPDGVKPDAEVPDGKRSTSKWMDKAIVIGLVFAVAYFAFDKFVLDPARDTAREAQIVADAKSDAVKGFYGDRSIAVLPFVNMSSDPEQEFFAEGISEEVLNLLASIRQLRVISRSSAFRFKGRDLNIPEVARQLDVAHILEGSVRKSGNMVRVTAQLIEARTDTHLWSQTYDRDFEDIFAIQDEIAADVARNLELALLEPMQRSRVTEPRVLALTAQARQLAELRPDGLGLLMEEAVSEALAIDPDYVPALEMLGPTNFFLWYDGHISKEERQRRDRQAEARILALDPDSATIAVWRAWDLVNDSNDYEGAAPLYERAVTRHPEISNNVRLASVFGRYIGKLDVAIRLGEHSVAIDPLCYQCLYQLSRTHFYAGNYKRAEALRVRFLALTERGGEHHFVLMKLLQGEYQAALAATKRLFAHNPTMAAALNAMVYHSLGRQAESDAELARVLAADEAEIAAYVLPDIYAWRGENDLAFEALYARHAEDPKHGQDTVFEPQFAVLHDDPRWTEWRAAVGLSKERLDAIEFDPRLPGD